MRNTKTRFEQVPIEVVRKIVAEALKLNSTVQPPANRKSLVKHPHVHGERGTIGQHGAWADLRDEGCPHCREPGR